MSRSEDSTDTEVDYLFAHGVRLARLHFDEAGAPEVGGAKLHVLFEFGDHLGSSSKVLDKATSELVEASTYMGYGQADSDYRPARWNGFREDYRFTGKEEDSEVGLTYFGKRFLSSALGRWASADPLAIHGLGADPNVYSYVSGSILCSVDPVGLEPRDIAVNTPGPGGTSQWTYSEGKAVTLTGSPEEFAQKTQSLSYIFHYDPSAPAKHGEFIDIAKISNTVGRAAGKPADSPFAQGVMYGGAIATGQRQGFSSGASPNGIAGGTNPDGLEGPGWQAAVGVANFARAFGAVEVAVGAAVAKGFSAAVGRILASEAAESIGVPVAKALGDATDAVATKMGSLVEDTLAGAVAQHQTEQAAAEHTIPQLVYRGGSAKPDNLTPRPGIDSTGLSTYDSLEAAVKPGEKAQVIDLRKLGEPLVGVPDAPPAGHVSIRPGRTMTPETSRLINEWAATRGGSTPHPFTLKLNDAIVDVIKRPK